MRLKDEEVVFPSFLRSRPKIILYPWSDDVMNATNAMTLTAAVVSELYKSDRVSEVMLSTLRGEITMVLSTGRAEFQMWEKEAGDELEVELATITASGPLTTPRFWKEVVEARGKFLMVQTGTMEDDKMCELFNELAKSKVRECVKQLGRVILVSRLLSTFPKGVNTRGSTQPKNAASPNWLWPNDAVDYLFERSTAPWMAKHLSCENVKFMTGKEASASAELEKKRKNYEWRI